MKQSGKKRLVYCPLAVLGVLACGPSSDLDRHALGAPAAADATVPTAPPSPTPAPANMPGSGPSTAARGSAPGSVAEQAPDGTLVPSLMEPASALADAGAPDSPIEEAPAPDAGVPPADETPPLSPQEPPLGPPPPPSPAPELPNDLRDAPVNGEIIFSDEAEWEVEGVFLPTFEIHTPTASYWVVKRLGTIVSIQDGEPDAAQWIDFSSGFRPSRGVPGVAFAAASPMTTVRDEDSQTPTHVRLSSASEDGSWQWVWDFYVTHVTFTVNRAPAEFGFAYQGVPGGSLGAEDQLVSSDGTTQGARNSFNGDLPGPFEWAYLADTGLERSLFLIQHTDDSLPERYQVRDNDSALLSLGDSRVTAIPMRFSLGLIPSVEHAAVTGRVEFVAAAIR
jgi:hypothetical protein